MCIRDRVRTDKVGPVSGSADFTLPTADGTAGQFMKTDGSLGLGFATATGVTTTKTTGTTTLTSGDASGYTVVPCDSSGGNVIIKLPAAASAWSGSVLHIVASAAPGSGYNVVIQNSAATELAQLNKKGDYYIVTCDSGGSNLVVIDHHQTYRGYLIATAQQDGAAHSLSTALMFNNPSNYTELENYGDWWDSANDKFTVPSGWVGSVELYANSGNASGSYLAVGVFKDGSQLIAPVLYSAASNSPFHWIESCTGTEEFQLKSYGTYTSGTKYAEAGLIFQWVGTRNA